MHVVTAYNVRRNVLSVLLLGASLVATSSASASTYPSIVRGSILSYAVTNAEGYSGDIAYGTPMKFSTMSIGVPNPDPV
ncbi:MAG: hypothetical protein ACLPKZ_03970, partial [Acidimicrobiales bacterium]